MVKHIILWKLKGDVQNPETVKANAKQHLEALQGKIPGLLEIKVQTKGLSTSNADMMLDSSFENEAALAAYAVHPLHVAAADDYVRPFTETRLCLDFETE